MGKKPFDPNALKALNEMKMEMARELGTVDTFANNEELDPVNNIFTAGPVGGLMTRKLVEIGEKDLIDKK